MGTACKCKICKKSLNTNDAYCVVANGKKSYYCSLAEYEEERVRKEKSEQFKKRFYKLFCEILGVSGITNTVLWKEKTEINKVFSDEAIVAYLEENKKWIANAVSKLNGGEYGKIRYVSVILKNKLRDYKPKSNMITTRIPDEHYETKYKNKVRIALEDLEEECCE